jgi:hypothetical protein
MFFSQDLDEQIRQAELKIEALAMRIESLDRQSDELFDDLKVTKEQLDVFIGNSSNFTEDNWVQLQELKKELDDKLKRELDNVRNPLKNKKTYSERNIGHNWLFVR